MVAADVYLEWPHNCKPGTRPAPGWLYSPRLANVYYMSVQFACGLKEFYATTLTYPAVPQLLMLSLDACFLSSDKQPVMEMLRMCAAVQQL